MFSLPTEHLAAARRFDDLPLIPPGFTSLRQVTAQPGDPEFTELSRGGRWFTMRVWGGMEGPFVSDLMRRDVPYFYPREDISYWSGGRRRQKRRKVFPGYVFFAGHDAELARAIESHWKLGVIFCSLQERLLSALDALECLIDRRLPFTIHRGLSHGTGQRVVVLAGPLMGKQGYLIGRRKNGKRLYIQFDDLQAAASTEIDPELVEEVS